MATDRFDADHKFAPACNRRAIVFQPGTQHAYQMALALQQAGCLELFLTGFYAKPSAFWRRASELFPPTLGTEIKRVIANRRFPGLDECLVRSRTCHTLAYQTLRRTALGKRFGLQLARHELEAMERWAGRFVARRRPGAAIAFDGSALGVFQAARKSEVPCILDQPIGHVFHGKVLLDEEAARHPAWLSESARIPDWMVTKARAEAAMADWILAPSDYVRTSLTVLGIDPSRIVTLPYGVDVDRFSPPAERPAHRFRILFVGHIGLRKGVVYLLEALRRLKRPDIECLLIGSMVGNPDGLKPYADLVTVIPQVARAEMPGWYRSADLFVFPSLHEGSSLSVYEALASGLPVITTPNAGSVVRDGLDGYIVPIRDIDALADRVGRLRDDEDLRLAMGRNARERALVFTWAHYHERLAAWYGTLAAAGAPMCAGSRSTT